MTSFHDLTMVSITGEEIDFASFSGQACLVVNVASECGLTPHYAGLVELHDSRDDVTVLGFPCNQFGAQEPGTDAQVCEFAQSRYGVEFPMFSKIDVNGENEAPLYTLLKAAQPGDGESGDIAWNFEKFLVGPDGTVVKRWSPMVAPADIAAELDELLA